MSFTLAGKLLPTDLERLPFELRSLAEARNYQSWVFRKVEPYLGRRILEIGAGIGNMSRWLPKRDRLILTENDPDLFAMLQDFTTEISADPRVSVQRFDLAQGDLAPYISENLDTIVSFNVLEHIENDQAALDRLCEILRRSQAPGPKCLITFVPAHNWAFGSMDRTFGHFRRYSKASLGKLIEKSAPDAKVSFAYFNVVGLAGWVFNGRILRKAYIGSKSIEAFERLCPYINPVDDLLHKHLRLPFGQSLVSIIEFS